MASPLNIKLMTFWRNSSPALAGRRTTSKSDKDSSLHSASLRSVQNDRGMSIVGAQRRRIPNLKAQSFFRYTAFGGKQSALKNNLQRR